MLFGDGDVYFDRESFAALHDTLSTGDKIAYGAVNIPSNKNSSWLVKLLEPTSRPPQACLYGRLYGIDNKKVTIALKSRGFEKMPEDLILEDLWLTLAIGYQNWATTPEAKVYFCPNAFSESSKMFKRQARGVRQIKENYAALVETENPLENSNRLKRLKETRGVISKLRACTLFAAHQLMRTYADIATKNENFANQLEGWEISEHSKQPIRR